VVLLIGQWSATPRLPDQAKSNGLLLDCNAVVLFDMVASCCAPGQKIAFLFWAQAEANGY